MSIMLEVQPSLGPALVVGGGAVAARKVRSLVEGGFATTVVAPEVNGAIAQSGATVRARRFEAGDTAGFALVFACTDDRAVNQGVGAEAREAGIPVLVADSQEESTFFSPAVHRDGSLLVGVSTGGASPSLARLLRDRVATLFGNGKADELAAAREARRARIEERDR